MTDEELIEAIANKQHAIWSHWMKYLFSISQENPDRSVTISAHNVARWTRQSRTAYADLTEQEQASDINQAKKVIAAIIAWQDDNA